MRRVGIFDSGEPDALVEPRGSCILSAQPDTPEALPRSLEQPSDQRFADAAISPGLTHVNAPNAAYLGVIQERIAIEAAHRRQLAFLERPAKNLSWPVEAVLSAQPVFHEPVKKGVAFFASLLPQDVDFR